MPRLCPFEIVLSKEEKHELHRRANKYTLPFYQVQRARMILLAADGMRNDEIAQCVGAGRDVVSLWRKRFFQERLAGLDERVRLGRPRTFSP
jgi:hypothetical protein